MKPCARNRRDLALLASDALDDGAAQTLLAHVASCVGCRVYYNEIKELTSKLESAHVPNDISANEAFHRRVSARICGTESAVKEQTVLALLGTWLKPGVVLPLIAVAAFVIVLFIERTPSNVPGPSDTQPVAAKNAENNLAPTIANYQVAANQSPDKLDALLARQANRNRSRMPIYTASTRSVETVSE